MKGGVGREVEIRLKDPVSDGKEKADVDLKGGGVLEKVEVEDSKGLEAELDLEAEGPRPSVATLEAEGDGGLLVEEVVACAKSRAAEPAREGVDLVGDLRIDRNGEESKDRGRLVEKGAEPVLEAKVDHEADPRKQGDLHAKGQDIEGGKGAFTLGEGKAKGRAMEFEEDAVFAGSGLGVSFGGKEACEAQEAKEKGTAVGGQHRLEGGEVWDRVKASRRKSKV